MNRWFLAAGAALLVGSGVAQATQDAAQQVETVLAEYQKAQTELGERMQTAESPAEQQRMMMEFMPRTGDFADRLWPVIDASPTGEAARKALLFVLGEQVPVAHRARAMKAWLAHHRDSTELLTVVDQIFPSLATVDFLEELHTSEAPAEIRGRATYALVQVIGFLKQAADQKGDISTMFPEEQREAMTRMFTALVGEDTLEWARTADTAKLSAHQEDLLAQIAKNFGDVTYRGSPLAERARNDLKELQTQGVGKAAPEISGEDIDGVPFKLSDYRGKVILLDFWGHW